MCVVFVFVLYHARNNRNFSLTFKIEFMIQCWGNKSEEKTAKKLSNEIQNKNYNYTIVSENDI